VTAVYLGASRSAQSPCSALLLAEFSIGGGHGADGLPFREPHQPVGRPAGRGRRNRLSIIGGAGDTQDAVGGLLGVSPLAVAKIIEALKTSGIDVAALLNRSDDEQAPVAEA
jgi:hypothetical protein